jgi:tetratricopeptide (TPR) repeat protein
MEAKKIMDSPVQDPLKMDPNPEPKSSSYNSESEKYKAAITEFEKLLQQHSGTETASLGQYFIGECYRKLGEYDKGIEFFRKYIRSADQKGALVAYALEGIAAALEAQGKMDEAKTEYKKLTVPPFSGGDEDRGLYHIARILQKEGKGEEAAVQFQEILKKHPNTIFMQDIENRLSVLKP